MADTSKQKLKLGFADNFKVVTLEIPKGEPRPWDADTELTVVGKPVVRRDGVAKVTGKATYTHDIRLPGMLHAAVLRSPYACCIVKELKLDAAAKSPGVGAVISLADVGERLLFAGQDVAAVAAATPEQARAALAAIVVTYEEQPHVVHTRQAMQPGAPLVHTTKVKARKTEGDEPGASRQATQKGNVRHTGSDAKKDVAKGLRAADVVHEAEYTTQVHTHSALETHSIVVRWDDAKHMTVWSSTQSIFSVRGEMADIFGLKPADVHVITEYLGGGFGAKFGASAPGSRLGFIAGTLAKQAKAPVSLLLDRHEEHVCTGNRPDSIQTVKLGAKKSGELTAIHVVAHGSAGIGTGAGVGRNAIGIYTRCPNIKVESADVYTNAGPGAAFRAPGHPQGAFALELGLDELAAKIGRDPLDIRIEHNVHPVRRHQFELGRKKIDWDQKRKRAAELLARKARVLRGVGVAASIWGDFGRKGAAAATVSVGRDGSIEVQNGVQDIGGGIVTVLAQIAAEVFRRPLETVSVKFGDSRYGASVGSGGSQTTSSVTPAVRAAAEKVKAQLAEVAAKELKVSVKDVSWDSDGTAHARKAKRSITFARLCQRMPGEATTATATRPGTYGHHPMKFMGGPLYQIAGVQFAEVAVDSWTGEVTVERVLAVHDCGRVMNPLTLRSQINGGVILGTSYALMEQRVMDRSSGLMLNPNLETYKIAGARDIPQIEVALTEVYTGANNTGAIGIGEPATIPTAAAIACAVFNATGAPVRSLPLTPDRVLQSLGVVPT